MDGDTDLDLVLGNSGTSRQNRLYLNDGNGTFTDATAGRMPADFDSTAAVALGDVDGDLDLDIVTGSSAGQNRLYLNNGTGVFIDGTAERMPQVLNITEAVALGDVDGDLDLDIVIGNRPASVAGQNRLYLNDGTGTFMDGTAGRIPADADDTYAVGLRDVDGDLDLDIVFGNGGRTPQDRLYLNNGTGTFTDATAARMPVDSGLTEAVALADVDGDADIEILTGNISQNRLYLNDGTTTFADVTIERLPGHADTHTVALGDVDADGDLDLAIGNAYLFSGQQNRLYLNDGTGTFVDATARLPQDSNVTKAVVFGDVDGDGDLDLVFGNGIHIAYRMQNRLYLNDGTGRFTEGTAARMPVDSADTEAVVLADVDGDADLDIVVGNSGQNYLYLNDGTGRFSDATAGRMPVQADATRALAVGDVDGDTDLDIVIANGDFPPERNRLYLNDGTGTFTDASAARMPDGLEMTAAVALEDVDGDLDLDIVFGNCNGTQNRLYVNDGTGTFNDETAARMPPESEDTYALAMGDVDEDGDPDIVLGNGFPLQPNRLYLNDGSGRFTDATSARMPLDLDPTNAVVLGDVDGGRGPGHRVRHRWAKSPVPEPAPPALHPGEPDSLAALPHRAVGQARLRHVLAHRRGVRGLCPAAVSGADPAAGHVVRRPVARGAARRVDSAGHRPGRPAARDPRRSRVHRGRAVPAGVDRERRETPGGPAPHRLRGGPDSRLTAGHPDDP